MGKETKKHFDYALLLPIALILIEIIVAALLPIFGYEIPEFLSIFLIFLGVYLLMQIAQQLLMKQQLKKGAAGLEKAIQLAGSAQYAEAIKTLKEIIFFLPREQYLEALAKLEEIYLAQKMPDAVQEIKHIQSESLALFDILKTANRISRSDRRSTQTRTSQLRKQIKALPENKVKEN